MKKGFWVLILFSVLLIPGLCAGAFYAKFPWEFWDRLLPIRRGETVSVVVRPDMNARQCAQAFYDQGALVGSPSDLAGWMTRFGIDRRFRPGSYTVGKADAWDLARQLRVVKPVAWTLTVIPGADVLSLRGVFDEKQNPSFPESGDLLRLSMLDDRNYPEPMRSRIPSSEEGRVAFLLPETYYVGEKSPGELVRAASRAWWERFGDTVLSSGLTSKDLRETATVASMVQREALWDDERATIAGVIGNRLKKNMLLQIDATVVYAWKLRGRNLTRVLHSDLEVNSPYNTYVFPGLPPAPICVPSAESWTAAFEPEESRYCYYVASRDGHHYFAETYEEHLRNIKKARAE